MSYYSDFSAEYQFERDFPFGIPCDVWTTKDGREIALKDMSISHILNCMRLVGEDDAWYHRFQKELDARHIKIQ